jgi:hypothetical protein
MRRALSLLAVVGVLTATRPAPAVESRGNVETDHLDATDDGGPRAAGVFVHPFVMAMGWLGAELDAAWGEYVVLSLEGDARWPWRMHGFRAVLGVALYPQRFAFHGIYIHPAFEWERSASDGVAATALGAGITVGYAWTWPVGASVRLGGGIAYAKGIVSDGPSVLGLEALRPEVDADLGWVF